MHRFRYSRHTRDELYGKKAEIKTFYENVVDAENAPPWVEWAPPAFPRDKRSRWEGFAIQQYRKCDDLWDPTRTQSFSLSHIRILSPLLRAVLQPILEPHGVSFIDDYVQIYAPLQPLYFERHKIQELYDEEAEGQTKEHLAILLSMVAAELGSTLAQTEDLEEKNETTHGLLWTLFPRNTIVAKRAPDNENVYLGFRTVDTRLSEDISGAFQLKCEHVRFDGTCYGFLERTMIIPYFTGTCNITSLPVFPLRNLKNDYDKVRQKMLVRGKRILEFQDAHYMRYMAPAHQQNEESVDEKYKLGESWEKQGQVRIMIDFQRSRTHGHTPKVATLPGYNPDASRQGDGRERLGRPRYRGRVGRRDFDGYDKRWYTGPPKDSDVKEREDRETKETTQFRRLTPDEQERNRTIVSRNEEDVLILDPYLDGFSLTSKTWQSFNIERIESLVLNSEAFDFLVHPEEKKSLVCAVVDDHAAYSKISRDVIAGKGQGLLILLSGNPGTGKTMMAEAIADKTQRPLYYVDSRDLGSPDHIERLLSESMENVAAWNAIMLLDEADVYLQKRSFDSLDRNKLVAVFLRLLEYYKGIMFLTTNLGSTIDEAIESRIQIHLKFPKLDHGSRSRIWHNFVRRPDDEVHNLTDEEITEVGKWVINGRQIRNVLRMAVAWSRQTGQPINVEMLEQVIPSTCPRAFKEVEEPDSTSDGTAPAHDIGTMQNGHLSKPSHSTDLLML